MSDAPMSRRARRTFEEEAADRAASQDPTVALHHGLAPGEHDEADTDTAAISRRDRRRMERLSHPLEAWTAEEEMLVTGQIPAMTPQRIAEQERISREKAAMAAEASQEFRRLAESEIRQAQAQATVVETPWVVAPVVEAPVAGVPAAVWTQAPPEPAYEAHEAPSEWAHETPADSFGDSEANPEPPPATAWSEQSWTEQSVAPAQASPVHTPPEFAWPEPALPEPALPEPAVPEYAVEESQLGARDDGARDDGAHEDGAHADGAHADRAVVEPYQPVMALDDEPLVHVIHPVHDQIPVTTEPEVVVAPVEERPNIFDALFPPGSSQSMLRQQDPFANGSPEGSMAGASGELPTLLPPQEVPERAVNAADEMRRLAAEAMSGIERAAKADEAAAAAAVLAANPSAASEFDSLPSSSSPVGASAQRGPSAAGPLSEFSWPPQGESAPLAGLANADPRFDSLGDMSRDAERTPGTPPGGLAPHYAEFDQLSQPRSAAPASGQIPTQGLPGPQGPAWTSYPPNPAQGGAVDPNDYTPISNVPTPDFSSLYQQSPPSAFPPVTGSINTSGFTTNDPTATGQTAAIRRPDLPEVGGAKHFKWLHLAVIGALMFVLGVVIYQVALAK